MLGLDAAVAGAVLAANGLGWDIVGIRDGYDGLLFPDRYPKGGVVTLDARAIDAAAVSLLASDRAISGQMLTVDGGLLTGFGEDLRPVVRKRMAEAQAAGAG